MKGLSPKTWLLVQKIFPSEADAARRLLVEQCGQNLPFCRDRDEFQLERLRFAASKISDGGFRKLKSAVDEAKRDWRDGLVWAGFAERLEAHELWAKDLLDTHA